MDIFSENQSQKKPRQRTLTQRVRLHQLNLLGKHAPGMGRCFLSNNLHLKLQIATTMLTRLQVSLRANCLLPKLYLQHLPPMILVDIQMMNDDLIYLYKFCILESRFVDYGNVEISVCICIVGHCFAWHVRVRISPPEVPIALLQCYS